MIHNELESGTLDPSASARQIAILLQSLPSRTHRVLLGQLDSSEVARIHKSRSSLGEVDAMEQYRVLKRLHDELQTETRSVETVESEIQDEIQIGRARVAKKRGPSIYRPADSSGERASGASDSDRTAEMAHTKQNSDRPDPDHSLSDDLFRFQSQTDVVAGQPAVAPTPEMLQSMFAQFHQTQAAGVLPEAAKALSRNRPSDRYLSDDEVSIPISSVDRRSAPQTRNRVDHEEQEAEEVARRVDLYLTQLSPAELCRSLGMVTTKQAFLVLCGLPNETAETVLEMLPRKQSRKVRSDMRRMGKLQLSEIDAAKRVVAQIAVGMNSGTELAA